MSQSDASTAVANGDADTTTQVPSLKRRESSSQQSQTSQTAADFIREQMQLEADAREALPYSIQNCTKPLGSLRQAVFACLTCNPPPADTKDPYNAAGVCYSCSVQCHGEHTLVEIFTKRNFTCDCGTTRFPATAPCTLREDPNTKEKGAHSEKPDMNNKYNQNFRNRFCGCECDYDPFQQKGTMYQCLGLGTHETGGCGEDWWHPGCVVGLGSKWFEKEDAQVKEKSSANDTATAPAAAVASQPLATISEDAEASGDAPPTAQAGPDDASADGNDDDDPPVPPGFPEEDSFEAFLCYKCVDAYPWIKRYVGTEGFLPAVFSKPAVVEAVPEAKSPETPATGSSLKRKADDEGEEEPQESKRHKSEEDASPAPQPPQQSSIPNTTDSAQAPKVTSGSSSTCKLEKLPPAPSGQLSLFMKEDFREHFCRCAECFPHLKPHPQLLEEEDTYEPPVSENGGSEHGGSTQGSLLEMGESALRGVDRVRAIEGVMAYNHLKDKLKTFLQPFAQSGEAVSAEHIKEIFAKLRGDDQAIKEAGESANKSADSRREQSGY
ncbi:hypothetical protein RB601_009290 [Gaeumannomyces tritici]